MISQHYYVVYQVLVPGIQQPVVYSTASNMRIYEVREQQLLPCMIHTRTGTMYMQYVKQPGLSNSEVCYTSTSATLVLVSSLQPVSVWHYNELLFFHCTLRTQHTTHRTHSTQRLLLYNNLVYHQLFGRRAWLLQGIIRLHLKRSVTLETLRVS